MCCYSQGLFVIKIKLLIRHTINITDLLIFIVLKARAEDSRVRNWWAVLLVDLGKSFHVDDSIVCHVNNSLKSVADLKLFRTPA